MGEGEYREVHYLPPPGGLRPEDDPGAQPVPPLSGSSLWVSPLAGDEHLWTATWHEEGTVLGATGTKAEMMEWAAHHPADESWTVTEETSDWVPLELPAE